MKKNQASSTALTVLQGILYIARHPHYAYLVDEPFKQSCEYILKASTEGQTRLKQLDNSIYRQWLVPVLERLLIPGITLHYVFRKRGIEDYVIRQLNEGVVQVINLGAGLDTLAYRLSPKYPAVTFIEIDHPATQTLKSQFLKEAKQSLTNLHYLPIDFTQQTLEAELSRFAAFSPQKATLFICEGVLMYLTETQVIALFASLKKLCQQQLSFVFTALEPENKTHNSLLKRYLSSQGEAIYWLKEKSQLKTFVDSQGFILEDIATDQILAQRYIKGALPAVLHQQEYLAFTKT